MDVANQSIPAGLWSGYTDHSLAVSCSERTFTVSSEEQLDVHVTEQTG